MDQEILERFERQDIELAAIRSGVDKIRRRLLWSSIINTLLFVVPLIGLVAIIPWFLDIISSSIPDLR